MTVLGKTMLVKTYMIIILYKKNKDFANELEKMGKGIFAEAI